MQIPAHTSHDATGIEGRVLSSTSVVEMAAIM